MMTAKGIAKLIEEMGELNQVLGKRLAYYTTEEHPDGGPPLKERMEDEIGDVLAACSLVMLLHGLDEARIQARVAKKYELFLKWEGDPTNNTDGIDATVRQSTRDASGRCKCKVCREKCSGGFIEHGRGCYVASEHGGGRSQCDCEAP